MRHVLAALALLAGLTAASAQNVSAARVGVQPTVDPEPVYVLDKNSVWNQIGTMTAGVFTPVPTAAGGDVNIAKWNNVVVGSPTAAGIIGTGNYPNINAYLTSAGLATAAAPSWTEGQPTTFSFDRSGGLRVSGGNQAAPPATFTPDNAYSTPLAVSSVSSAGGTALPGSVGSVVRIYNRGPSSIFYQLGNSSVIAATSNTPLAPNCWDSVVVKAGQTNIAALTNGVGLLSTMNVESGTGPPRGGCGPVNSGFTPAATGARMTPLSVGLGDSSTTLPNGASVVVDNTDVTYPVYCNVNGVPATIADKKIHVNSWFQFGIPPGQNTLHCIATGGPAIVNGLGGAGVATGAGGGGGSSGGSGGSGGGGTSGNVVVTNNSTQPIPTYPANLAPTQVQPYGPFPVTVIGQIFGSKTVPISILGSNVPTTVVLQTGVGGQLTYITTLAVSALPGSSLYLEEGSGTNCATGTIILTGPIPMNGSLQGANGGASPAIQTQVVADDLCAVVTTLTAYGGWMQLVQR